MDTLFLVTPSILRSLSDYRVRFSLIPCGKALEIGAFQDEPKKVGCHGRGHGSRLSFPPRELPSEDEHSATLLLERNSRIIRA
jgi:hypothetical protein